MGSSSRFSVPAVRARRSTWSAIRGLVVERLEGEDAFRVIDRISHKYIGQPYPLRSDRVVYLVEIDRAMAQDFA